MQFSKRGETIVARNGPDCVYLCATHLAPCILQRSHPGDCVCEQINACYAVRQLERIFWRNTKQ